MIDGVVCGHCDYGYTCNTAQYCVEITNDNVVLQGDEDFWPTVDGAVPDKDIDGLVSACLADPEGTEYIENTHTGNEDCPDLSATAFPYYDTDGEMHFCRKCDKVWKKDPHCVRNLWKEQNCALCAAMPDYDCCGYPCTMEKLIPLYKGDSDALYLDECDIELDPTNPVGWMTGIVSFKHFNLSLGKVGFVMSHVDSAWQTYPQVWKKNFEFDLNTRKYSVMDPGIDVLTYYNGAKLSNVKSGRDDKMEYLLYSNNSSWQVAYPKKIRQTVYNPVINETWAFANIKESDALSTKMMYAKIGEWKWTSLGEGIGNGPNFNGNWFGFYTDDFKGYLCDLSKAPQSSADCSLINRGEEQIRHVVIDKTNEKIIYFSPVAMKNGFIRVDLSKTPAQYEEITQDIFADDKTMNNIAAMAVGNLILYSNISYTNETLDEWDNRLCYYRYDLKKSYCSLPTPHKDGILEYRQGSAEFEGHWVVWQDSTAPYMKARDMECYCDRHPELCPFDDYTPQPDNPKDVKTGERQ